jgi:pimeloyl-ACP methyl ester carboxylesterase
MLKSRLHFYFCFLAFIFVGLSLHAQTQKSAKGQLIKSEQIAVFDQDKLTKIVNEELGQFLNSAPIPFESYQGRFSEPKNKLTLYKLTYQTTVPEQNMRPTIATGLIAIPDIVKDDMPMISYQHGTVFGKEDVPSSIENSMEMKLILAQFGGQGYICIGADYIGLGDSKEPNSYFSMSATEEACMDMYTAANQFLKQKQIKTGPFFTMGWSQGGYNNMVFLRRLERSGVPVKASATAAAPVDLNFFITRGLTNPRPIDAIFTPASISNLLFSFENYYKIPGLAASIIRPEFYAISKDFYDFKIGFLVHLQKTTGKVSDFLKPEFVEDMKMGRGKVFKILQESEAYRWVSTTPLRAYYGMQDEAVPDYIARLAVEYQSYLGKKNGETFNAGEKADHRDTYIHALIEVKPWFDTFLK